MTKQQIEQELEALQSLIRHPGWEILTRELKRRAAAEMSGMRNSKSQDELLKHTYTYMALSDLPAAPEVLAGILNQRLQVVKK